VFEGSGAFSFDLPDPQKYAWLFLHSGHSFFIAWRWDVMTKVGLGFKIFSV
jgi:hypothetical protein